MATFPWEYQYTPAHWGWGVLGGAIVGRAAFGDEWWQVAAGAALGTPWGHRALAFGTRTVGHGLWWAAGTRTGLAVRSAAWGATSFAFWATAAVVVPVGVGGLVSMAIAGDEGREDYMDYLHSFNPMSDRGISMQEWWDAVTLKSMR